MQTKNKSNHTTGENMTTKTIYQQLVTIHNVYKAHFVEIRMGARQGRLWTLETFQKALEGAGLKSKLIGQNEGDPREPQMGDYLLLVENRFLIDMAYDRRLDPVIEKTSYRVPWELIGKELLIFNFGSHKPEYMSPYDERIEEAQKEDDDDPDL